MLEVVEQTQRRSQWPLEPILACLGVPRSVYFSWRARAEEEPLAESPRGPTSYDRLLPDEVEAIKEFALRHPKTGYRKLTYMMLDQDIACVSAASSVTASCVPSSKRTICSTFAPGRGIQNRTESSSDLTERCARTATITTETTTCKRSE